MLSLATEGAEHEDMENSTFKMYIVVTYNRKSVPISTLNHAIKSVGRPDMQPHYARGQLSRDSAGTAMLGSVMDRASN